MVNEPLNPKELARFSGLVPVLDFDGVVADTEPLHALAYKAIIRSHIPDLVKFSFSKYIGYSEKEIYRMINRDLQISMSVDKDMPRRLTEFERLVYQNKLEPSSLAIELFSQEKKVHILSSQDPDIIDRLMKRWGFSGKYFQIQYRDDFSSKFEAIPHISSYINCENAEVLYAEDSARAITLGSENSFKTIFVSHSLNGDPPKEADHWIRI